MITFLKSVMISRLDNEMVLMDTESGHYYSLNESATEMVELLINNKSIEKSAKLIADKYLVSFDQVVKDLNKLIKELKVKGLLTVTS
ncbi:MAG: PqqD family protein [Sphaerochaetaceae bacterium]|nr:PqqD family protein [Sphaerochaetaceae bacterium]